MSGFLKKELLAAKKLPLKWQGFVGQIFDVYGSALKKPEYIEAFFFLNDDSKDYYYYSKNFQIDVKYNISLIDEPLKSDDVVCNLMVRNSVTASELYTNVIQICQRAASHGAAGKIQCWSHYPGHSYGDHRLVSVPRGTKYAWFRLIHAANGSDKMYYSFDGKSYTLMNTITLPKSYWNAAYTRQNIVTPPYSNLEDIRFTVEGKLVFGKVE